MQQLEPLNPVLFARLERYYGKDNVEIVSAGLAIDWRIEWEFKPEGGRRPKRKIYSGGEEYRVRCKLCRDWKPRLHINHRWGAFDTETQTRNLWMANCFNEGCYSGFTEQAQLYDSLFSPGNGRNIEMPILEGREDNDEVNEISPAGLMWSLEHLKQKHPNHPAVLYLEGRGYDVMKLSKLWGISYCADSRYENARDRIIIPIRFEDQLVGWQARYIGDSFNGTPFNEAGVPKYWTSPGFKRKLVAYNMERAVRHSTVVIVEGPVDTWNVGPAGIGLIGKSLSPKVANWILSKMAKHGEEGVVVVCLDPEPDPRDMLKNKPHHIERAAQQLRLGMGGRVVPVYLPIGYDPGSIDREWLRSIISEQATKIGIKARFRKPCRK